MAEAKKCDICGEFYIPETYHGCKIKIINKSAKPYDLCDECQHNLEVFVNHGLPLQTTLKTILESEDVYCQPSTESKGTTYPCITNERQYNLEVFVKSTPEDNYSSTQETNDELDIPMQAIDDESSNHDAYKIYKCPKCEKKFHKYQERLADHRCPYCKQKLKI